MNTLKGIGGCTIGATATLAAGFALRVGLGIAPEPTFIGVVISLSVYVLFGLGLGVMIVWERLYSVRYAALMCAILGTGGLTLACLFGIPIGLLDAGTAIAMTTLGGAAGAFGFLRAAGLPAQTEALCAG